MNIQYIGPSILVNNKTLIIGDLHIGSDQALAASGALSPVVGLTEIKETLSSIFKQCNPEKIILLGDIAVTYQPLTYAETVEIRKLLSFLKDHCDDIVLIKGNHDMFITKIIESLKIPFVESIEESEFLCTHGDTIIQTDKKTLFIGHEHPAIKISNGIRHEKFKCILKTTYEDKTLYVLPSLNKLTIGTDILTEKTLSPYLNEQNISKAEVIIVEDMNAYAFGKVKNLINQ